MSRDGGVNCFILGEAVTGQEQTRCLVCSVCRWLGEGRRQIHPPPNMFIKGESQCFIIDTRKVSSPYCRT